MRVLYVEDNPGDVGLLEHSLRDERPRIEVLAASTLTRGLELLETVDVQAVLLDLGLPDATGLEGLVAVRGRRVDLPVLVVTGREDPELEQSALRQGAQDYLLKGRFDAFHIRRAIRHAVERQEILEALAESDSRHALFAEASSDGLWDWDLRAPHPYFSPRLRVLLGWPLEGDPSLEDWLQRVHISQREDVARLIQACRDGQQESLAVEFEVASEAGEESRWMELRACVRRSEGGEVRRLACSQREVTERKRQEERIRRHAYFDAVTDLPNRALLLERIGRLQAKRDSQERSGFALLFLDLDDFKLVNDSLGHLAGDQVLVEVAARLSSCVRPEDTVARLGGDEFVILLQDAGSVAKALRVAVRIEQVLARPLEVSGRELFVRASIGITVAGRGSRTPQDLLREADTALYRAKARGGGYEVFDRSMQAQAMAQLELEAELKRAVDGSGLEVYFQPILELATRRLTGFEALVRWSHPRRGLLSPGAFLETAADLRLVQRIDRNVLEQACAWIRELQAIPGARAMSISVNCSTATLTAPGLETTVQRVLADTGLAPHNLHLEISEHCLLTEDPGLPRRLTTIEAMGVAWHLDDFGTGHSQLGALGRYPIRSLKLDRTFIERLPAEAGASKVVRGILSLARDLDMSVIAEGIERADQARTLEDFGCAAGQGYFFSPALPGDEARAFAEHHLSMT